MQGRLHPNDRAIAHNLVHPLEPTVVPAGIGAAVAFCVATCIKSHIVASLMGSMMGVLSSPENIEKHACWLAAGAGFICGHIAAAVIARVVYTVNLREAFFDEGLAFPIMVAAMSGTVDGNLEHLVNI